jgi:RimJ/RimL family protein N-acetyltransferase
MKITIKESTEEDSFPLLAMTAMAERKFAYKVFTKKNLQNLGSWPSLGSPVAFVKAFNKKGSLVGICSYGVVGDLTSIIGVVTFPAYRRKGVASAMIRHITNKSIKVKTSTRFKGMKRLLKNLGFRSSGLSETSNISDKKETMYLWPQLQSHRGA